jgi:cyclic pyranopterin phosphate synthase
MTRDEQNAAGGHRPTSARLEADAAPANAASHASEHALIDAKGRCIHYARVSLTDRCNFRCTYCMPPEGVPKLRHEDILRLEELTAIVRVLVTDLGVSKVRVTGGEPLIRGGAVTFLREVGAIPELRDLALTTNGFLLHELAADIRAAGVRRLNISIDTLRRDRFHAITGVDGLERVLRGIDAARAAGFAPIKLNVVMLRSVLDEATDLLRFGIDRGLEVRFIELMAGHKESGSDFVSTEELMAVIGQEFKLEAIRGDALARQSTGAMTSAAASAARAASFSAPPSTSAASPAPAAAPTSPAPSPSAAARLYRIAGHSATCGFISPVTAPFCGTCDRIRLRADGHLVPCLSSDARFDLKPFVRPDFRREALIGYIREALSQSKAEAPRDRRIRTMSRIGG